MDGPEGELGRRRHVHPEGGNQPRPGRLPRPGLVFPGAPAGTGLR